MLHPKDPDTRKLQTRLDYCAARFKLNKYSDFGDKMNCYYHPSRKAVAQCPDCHKGLCYKCAHKYNIPLCDECNNKRKSNYISNYLGPIVVCLILFITGCCMKFMGPDPLLNGYIIMSIYGGWMALNHFLPTILVWFNLSSVFWYIVIKLILALILGVFITPIYLIFCVYKLISCMAK